MKFFSTLMLMVAVFLMGCTDGFKINTPKTSPTSETVNGEVAEKTQPKPRPKDLKEAENLGHITVAEAAQVSDAELKEAVSKPTVKSEKALGTTVVSLGLIDESGFWLSTPLVKSEKEGRVVYGKTGKSVNLRLKPNGLKSGSGSQISIAAMNVLGISIVDLAEVQVYAN